MDASLVLQIAQEDGGAVADTMPLLRDILEDKNILKAGVGVDQDMLELFRWEPLELQDVSARMDIGGIGGGHGRTASLKSLANKVLGVDLPKSKKLAMSNWGKAPLDKQQIAYAARDAWASAAVLHELAALDPTTYSTEALLDLILPDECTVNSLDCRAAARKKVKTKLLDILEKDGEKIDRRTLSEAQNSQVAELEKEFKSLAPPKPVIFDIELRELGSL